MVDGQLFLQTPGSLSIFRVDVNNRTNCIRVNTVLSYVVWRKSLHQLRPQCLLHLLETDGQRLRSVKADYIAGNKMHNKHLADRPATVIVEQKRG